ncbi:dihydropteroate synthase [Peribacillus frigoritolerans]|jgi:dihydropteroate synthase|uniref:Dihydropteroate synthase n=1 Tax=Peribacillus frigoritolerans TaxID=450367 RepID=A0AAJ1QID2_9BACI|nr:dihydropteroate synthase [Peribacillus frigoritolerans]MDP9743540.1 dihydropteroate synthase [Bacillus sp. B2I3]QYF83048.1 dihydropteroate synthase [Brevibacterium sp. PAMC21349]MCY9007282.1 dihydropteroate synthase [Peribacillus frigoritolerans]MDM5282048.1 dihydropteroate synthase [Peribacillus frigoritolerans]MED3762123.1 dihydropteroate synthase [Peribacillus frigoritolerans]
MSLAGASKIKCGSFDLDYSNKTLIMGILNVTPDSFSDGGKYNRIDAALKHAERMVNDGADILDVGGESTRPNYERISEEEEIERVAPIIEAISRNIEVPISVDTYKSRVAEAAVKAGAHILNDIWGGKADSLMSKVAAEYKVPIILMHNRGNMEYGHFVRDVLQDLFESIMLVKDAGVKDENIILDPGIGFAKDLKLNLEMMRNLDKLVSLGYPVLLATSRKSMIGHVLDLPPSERMEGTAATICHGIQQGCQMVRVHDVKEMARTAKMMDALLGKGE